MITICYHLFYCKKIFFKKNFYYYIPQNKCGTFREVIVIVSKLRTHKNYDYGTIQRGTSLTIPVFLKKTDEEPFLITEDCEISFTIKAEQHDFDFYDARAFVQKDFTPQDGKKGTFFITLSSADLNFPVGKYYFDIELINLTSGAVCRLATLFFNLEGGPTNRRVNQGMGHLPVGDGIHFTMLDQGPPIVVIVPTATLEFDFLDLDKLKEDFESLSQDFLEQQEVIVNLKEEISKLQDYLENFGNFQL